MLHFNCWLCCRDVILTRVMPVITSARRHGVFRISPSSNQSRGFSARYRFIVSAIWFVEWHSQNYGLRRREACFAWRHDASKSNAECCWNATVDVNAMQMLICWLDVRKKHVTSCHRWRLQPVLCGLCIVMSVECVVWTKWHVGWRVIAASESRPLTANVTSWSSRAVSALTISVLSVADEKMFKLRWRKACAPPRGSWLLCQQDYSF